MKVYAWLIDWFCTLPGKLPYGYNTRVNAKSDSTWRDNTVKFFCRMTIQTKFVYFWRFNVFRSIFFAEIPLKWHCTFLAFEFWPMYSSKSAKFVCKKTIEMSFFVFFSVSILFQHVQLFKTIFFIQYPKRVVFHWFLHADPSGKT